MVGVPLRGEGDLLAVLVKFALSLLLAVESLLLLEAEKVVAAGLGGAGVRLPDPAPLDELEQEPVLEVAAAAFSVTKGDRLKSL